MGIKTALVVIITALCVSLFFSDTKRPSYVKLACKIRAEAAHKIEQECNLHLIGTGGGMIDTVNCLSLSFQLHHEVDIEEGREIVVCAVEELLKAINGSEDIRPHLRQYPFTAKDVEIWTWIKQPDRRDVPVGSIDFILSSGGKVSYSVQKSEEEEKLKTWSDVYFLREPYEEALKKVRGSQVED